MPRRPRAFAGSIVSICLPVSKDVTPPPPKLFPTFLFFLAPCPRVLTPVSASKRDCNSCSVTCSTVWNELRKTASRSAMLPPPGDASGAAATGDLGSNSSAASAFWKGRAGEELLAAAAAAAAAALAKGAKLVDCSHTITPKTLTFAQVFNLLPGKDGEPTKGFTEGPTYDTRTAEGAGFKKCIYCLPCDVGTHIDSPSHWFPGMRDIAELTLDELTAPGAVIDISHKINTDTYNYGLTVADLEAFEAKYGEIPPKALVVAKTGWGERDITSTEAYVNGGNFPGFSPEAAKWLLDKDIVGIGIDTASLDPGTHEGGDFPVHKIILGADKYQIENMKLCHVPEGLGSVFVSLPLKIEGGPEAETRVMALVSANPAAAS
eukprot:Tamp_17403.p1 GENE.Tamp_17403~~Tamp_17403.p1  ORF type:complete len:377 (-),score=65.29 Tamp_17403:226-1356(-)